MLPTVTMYITSIMNFDTVLYLFVTLCIVTNLEKYTDASHCVGHSLAREPDGTVLYKEKSLGVGR